MKLKRKYEDGFFIHKAWPKYAYFGTPLSDLSVIVAHL